MSKDLNTMTVQDAVDVLEEYLRCGGECESRGCPCELINGCNTLNEWGGPYTQWDVIADHAMEVIRNSMEAKKNIDLNTRQLFLTHEALVLACESIACDDQCPYGVYEDFDAFPECSSCSVNNPTGAMVYQDVDRDTMCWVKYYMQKAEGDKNEV